MDEVHPEKEWEPTYLIQRLQAPTLPRELGPNPTPLDILMHREDVEGLFGFGGGPGSCHNKVARKLLGLVYQYDYMGASEFEWGIVGNAIHAISERGKFDASHDMSLEFVTYDLTIPDFVRPSDIGPGQKDKLAGRFPKEAPASWITRPVYVICPRMWLKQGMPLQVLMREAGDPSYEQKDTNWDDRSQDPGCRLKERSELWRAAVAEEHAKVWEQEDKRAVIGGLDCNNGWVYFTRPTPAAFFWLLMGQDYSSMPQSVKDVVSETDAGRFINLVDEVCRKVDDHMTRLLGDPGDE